MKWNFKKEFFVLSFYYFKMATENLIRIIGEIFDKLKKRFFFQNKIERNILKKKEDNKLSNISLS